MIRKLEKIGWGQIVKKASLVTQWYNPPASAKDPGLSLGGEDPLEKQPTPVFLPGKSHGRGAWWATVHGVPKSQTRLSD